MNQIKFWTVVSILMLMISCQPEWVRLGPKYDYRGMNDKEIELHRKIEAFLYHAQHEHQPLFIPPDVRVQTVNIDEENQFFEVELSKSLAARPWRRENVKALYEGLRRAVKDKFSKYHFVIKSLGVPVEELIPNIYRSEPEDWDISRLPEADSLPPAQVVKQENIPDFPLGLTGKNIALWPSHGWYYSFNAQRWEWQRPRLFQTVEDLESTAFILSYLVPMLEAAGAAVYLPRERDIQINEVIVDDLDNKTSFSSWSVTNDTVWQIRDGGFGYPGILGSDGINPFQLGRYHLTRTESTATAGTKWIPDIPERGWYTVSVTYHSDSSSCADSRYTVNHTGGSTKFIVDQRRGGGTWIYLGRFLFDKGQNPEQGSVSLENQSGDSNSVISADAVRFGGGMGSVSRGGTISGRPRFMEAARYWLQYAGFPDSLVYKMAGDSNDYVDDYKSRPEFSNYLSGRPNGPSGDTNIKGLGIPVDLTLAFHTDAGVIEQGGHMGSMVIYSLFDADSQRTFANGVSRLANRDLADVLQTQLVGDIRSRYDMKWPRRAMKEAWYSEAARPHSPSVLLELFSHQNFADAGIAADPRFRFDVCRSIYKGLVKFLAGQYRRNYQIQPLPVQRLSAFADTAKIVVSWQAQEDEQDPSARPEYYIIYTRVDSGGFDNGQQVSENRYIFTPPQKNKIYSFMVRAGNDGGLSMPSQIVSARCGVNESRRGLIVNGFNRISAPAMLEVGGFAGFVSQADEGVPDRLDFAMTGQQFRYDRNAPFISNDAPGHGASFADMETSIIAGNSFDFIYCHGNALTAAGWGFSSCSAMEFEAGTWDLSQFDLIDWIAGEQKYTPGPDSLYEKNGMDCFELFTGKQIGKLERYLQAGGNLFLSGAYVGGELNRGRLPADPAVRFSRQFLKLQWITDHAARTGEVWCVDSLLLPAGCVLHFNQAWRKDIYRVESPDAINALHSASTLMRYRENNFSAAIGYRQEYGVIVCAFPFESIVSTAQRNYLMRGILNYLTGADRSDGR